MKRREFSIALMKCPLLEPRVSMNSRACSRTQYTPYNNEEFLTQQKQEIFEPHSSSGDSL